MADGHGLMDRAWHIRPLWGLGAKPLGPMDTRLLGGLWFGRDRLDPLARDALAGIA